MVSRQETPSRTGGRPEYKPTDEQRARVRELRQQRAALAIIASDLKISPNTLRKHFAAELAAKSVSADGELDFTQAAPAPFVDQMVAPSSVPGRPEFEPSHRQREEVKLAKADNWADERIARYLGISRSTLLKHFADELERGTDMLRMAVLRDVKASAAKGNRAAAEMVLNLPGMITGVTVLPTPGEEVEPPTTGEAAVPGLGKKEQARRDAQAAHKGTAWDRIVN